MVAIGGSFEDGQRLIYKVLALPDPKTRPKTIYLVVDPSSPGEESSLAGFIRFDELGGEPLQGGIDLNSGAMTVKPANLPGGAIGMYLPRDRKMNRIKPPRYDDLVRKVEYPSK